MSISVIPDIIWSLDDGFGDYKGFDGTDVTLIPNFIKPLSRIRVKDENEEINPDERIISEVFDNRRNNSELYIVGIGALEKEKGGDWNGSVKFKHLASDFKAFLSTVLCMMAEPYNDVVDVDMLVMGLPVEEHEEEERRETLVKLAKGQHTATITMGNNEPFTRTVNIKDVKIEKQPAGTIFDFVFNDEGKFKEESIIEEFNIVSDIGARTHNRYGMKGMRQQDDFLGTSNSGIYSAYEFLQSKLASEGRPVSISQIVAHLDSKKIGNFDFSAMLESAFDRLASTIVQELDTSIQESRESINNIIITGGGSEVLKPYLEPLLKKLFKNQEIYWGTRFTAAKGFRKFGVRVISNKKGKSAKVRRGN